MRKSNEIIETSAVESLILVLRGRRVILDADLARLYGVTTKRLNEQVRRNARRFPYDFAFKLSGEEKGELVANCDRFKNLKHSTSLPTAFTEHGTIMAANVLNADRAVDVSVLVVRAFVQIREALAANDEIAAKLSELENRIEGNHSSIQAIVRALRRLMHPAVTSKRKIGFGDDQE